MEEMKKYRVMLQFTTDVNVEIEATSEDEAMEMANCLGTIEYCNGTVGVNDYDIDGEVELMANYLELVDVEEV